MVDANPLDFVLFLLNLCREILILVVWFFSSLVLFRIAKWVKTKTKYIEDNIEAYKIDSILRNFGLR